MTRSDTDLLADVADAITAIRSHLQYGQLSQGIVMDAVSMRLIEIGEAVKSLSAEITMAEPGIMWRRIARMRDVLAHHYFATRPDIIQATVDNDLPDLEAAIRRMITRAEPTG